MNLKGNYDGTVAYEVEDVVLFTDGFSYFLKHPCPAGTPPVNTLYWNRTSQTINDVVKLCIDAIAMANSDDVELEDDLKQSTKGKKALDAHQGKVLKGLIDAVDGKVPTNINATTITLKDASDNEYVITVDTSGETPALAVTAVTSEGGDT